MRNIDRSLNDFYFIQNGIDEYFLNKGFSNEKS